MQKTKFASIELRRLKTEMLCFMIFQAVEEFKKGKVEFRVDKTGIVHIPFGKLNFEEDDLLINLLATVVCSFILKTIYLLVPSIF